MVVVSNFQLAVCKRNKEMETYKRCLQWWQEQIVEQSNRTNWVG